MSTQDRATMLMIQAMRIEEALYEEFGSPEHKADSNPTPVCDNPFSGPFLFDGEPIPASKRRTLH